MTFQNLFNKFRDFFHKREDFFLFLGLSFFPVLTIIRIIVRFAFPPLYSSYVLVILLFATYTALIAMTISYQKVNQFLIPFCVRVANYQWTQRILFFFLIFEQMLLIHPAWFSLVWFCTSFLLLVGFDDPYFSLPTQLLIAVILLYYRVRKNLLNVPAFAEVGVLVDGKPIEWKTVFEGLNAILERKIESLQVNTLEGRARIPRILNQLPDRSNIAFPFFPSTRRANYSTSSAFWEFLGIGKEQPSARRATHNSLVASTVSVCAFGIYSYFRAKDLSMQQQRIDFQVKQLKQQALEHQDRLKQQAIEHHDNSRIEAEKIAFARDKLRVELEIEKLKLVELKKKLDMLNSGGENEKIDLNLDNTIQEISKIQESIQQDQLKAFISQKPPIEKFKLPGVNDGINKALLDTQNFPISRSEPPVIPSALDCGSKDVSVIQAFFNFFW